MFITQGKVLFKYSLANLQQYKPKLKEIAAFIGLVQTRNFPATNKFPSTGFYLYQTSNQTCIHISLKYKERLKLFSHITLFFCHKSNQKLAHLPYSSMVQASWKKMQLSTSFSFSLPRVKYTRFPLFSSLPNIAFLALSHSWFRFEEIGGFCGISMAESVTPRKV